MADCKNITHPFLTDPGTSQRQRIMEDLLSGRAQIDGRSLADLLDFFVQLSSHINYYDEQMEVSDWRPFFDKSLPFTLAGIIKYDYTAIGNTITDYKTAFEKKPSVYGLQLLLNYVYNQYIRRINQWQSQISGSGLSIEQVIEKVIKDKAGIQVKNFIRLANTATKWYCTKNFNFSELQNNGIWELKSDDIYGLNETFLIGNNTSRKKLIALYDQIMQTAIVFPGLIRIVSTSAGLNLEQSLLPLNEELKQKNPPHLAVLFAFLKMFSTLQGDLNNFTKNHLDYFYKQVLQLKPKQAIADKVHVIAEIQKQLDKYLLKKGTLIKGGKDLNKAEILFALDEELVINKTQIADQRCLFLNNIPFEQDHTFLEGVYMVPDATKANGIDKEFKDTTLPSRAALGAKWSKYTDPENKFIYPYPNARLGFILASPVLLLNEGLRIITIRLACKLSDNYCATLQDQVGINNPCCDQPATQEGLANKNQPAGYPPFKPASALLEQITALLKKKSYYISRPLIAAAVKKGISKELEKKLYDLLVIKHVRDQTEIKNEVFDSQICYCPTEEKLFDKVISEEEYTEIVAETAAELVNEIIIPLTIFNVRFSGEKAWIPAPDKMNITIDNFSAATGEFNLKIETTLTPDLPSVTFYNAETLKENLNTTLPLVKIELNDQLKIIAPINTNDQPECCQRKSEQKDQFVSLYHFFRNTTLQKETKIDVQVCGLKQLVVQNDESLQDVNAPIFAFGTRPKVGASFYIGSKEVFSKNWQSIYANTEWKDRPKNFEKHYEHYPYKTYQFENGSTKIVESSFRLNAAVLHNGEWKTNGERRLFKPIGGESPDPVLPPPPPKVESSASFCNHPALAFNQDVYDYTLSEFSLTTANYKRKDDLSVPLLPLNVSSKYGFLRFTLGGINFQQEIYPFVLARQMMAYAGLVSPEIIGKVLQNAKEAQTIINVMIGVINNIVSSTGSIQTRLVTLSGDISTLNSQVTNIESFLNDALTDIPLIPPRNIPGARANINSALGIVNAIINAIPSTVGELTNDQAFLSGKNNSILQDLTKNPGAFDIANPSAFGLAILAAELKTRIDFIEDKLKVDEAIKDGLPSEPYTPVIKSLSLDYTATADVADIDLIHLYPYTGTYKPESLQQEPTLLPTFCDEGSLFLGLKNLVPGSNLNILFQLAEATADSESPPELIKWHYLENNTWKLLRPGFEIVNDDTHALTTSGIVKFALPANMTSENTILPTGLHWIKASIPKNSSAVSEIISLHTQAVKATFTNTVENDRSRLNAPLPAGAVAKLEQADASVTKITQPYESFGGAEPEETANFYVRVSELLRHKNRAIQKFDYERLALEFFPDLFKVKCINHSYFLNAHQFVKDFTVAPGYVMLAVIPDLNRLKAAASFEPKVPVSLLEEITSRLQKLTSPFVRIKVVNPRYEKVNFCLRIKLLPGRDENYYNEQLKKDISEFLAPWAVGQYDKLTFGQPINQSDLVRFLEGLDYMDYIIELKMRHADDPASTQPTDQLEVVPLTPRSILIAGNIDVCIHQGDCEEWTEPACKNEPYHINNYCGAVVGTKK